MVSAELFQEAERAFLAGRIDEAHAHLLRLGAASSTNARVQHLLALVEKRRGDSQAARSAFEAARRLAPGDCQIAANAGHFCVSVGDHEAGLAAYEEALAGDPGHLPSLRGRAACLASLGRPERARYSYRALLDMAPEDPRSWIAYGAFERDQGELDASAAAYDRALALAPTAPVALHGRARVALERGEADAADRFAHAEQVAPSDPQVALGAAEAAVAADQEQALARLENLTERFPQWAEPHSALARLRWERGESESFAASLEKAVNEHPGSAPLWHALVAAYAGVDRPGKASEAASRASSAGHGDEFLLLEASHSSEAGDLDRAEALFARIGPVPGAAVASARHALRRGDLDRAAALLDGARDDAPDDILAWAWTELVWRALGDPRCDWLHQSGELVGVAALEAVEDELAAISEAVAELHHARSFPIGQSLRGGTQTRGRLFNRVEPEVRRLKGLIERAVADYWRGLPPADPGHPLLRHRDSRPRFAGSWSVRLTDGGFHVSHIHPAGILSSACYLRVPHGEPGLLELGRPPAGIALELQPVASIEPRAGRLALFPSFLFHGTRAFAQGERLTVAFDVVPASAQ
jgi:tetratricopeptide (TPR) repeat protein